MDISKRPYVEFNCPKSPILAVLVPTVETQPHSKTPTTCKLLTKRTALFYNERNALKIGDVDVCLFLKTQKS